MDEYIKFRPRGKVFCYNFNKYDCCEINSKQCIVTEDMKPINYNRHILEHNAKEYCHRIASLILLNGFREDLSPIYIEKCSCGHYVVDGGRHRLCIAGKLDIEIKVILQEIDSTCQYCSYKKEFLGLIKNKVTNNYYLKKL